MIYMHYVRCPKNRPKRAGSPVFDIYIQTSVVDALEIHMFDEMQLFWELIFSVTSAMDFFNPS